MTACRVNPPSPRWVAQSCITPRELVWADLLCWARRCMFQLLPCSHTSHCELHAILHSVLIDAIRKELTWNMHAALRHNTEEAESLVSTWVPKRLEFRHCNGKELAPGDSPSLIIPHSSVKEKEEHMWIDSPLPGFYLTQPNWKQYKAIGVLTNTVYNPLNWCQCNLLLYDIIVPLSSCSVGEGCC